MRASPVLIKINLSPKAKSEAMVAGSIGQCLPMISLQRGRSRMESWKVFAFVKIMHADLKPFIRLQPLAGSSIIAPEGVLI